MSTAAHRLSLPQALVLGVAALLLAPLAAGAETSPTSDGPVAHPTADAERFRLDAGLTFTRFEQQIKSEIGGARGERLVEEFKLGLLGQATWRFWGPLSLGLYGRFDTGQRKAGRFAGLDAESKTVVEGEVGGPFTELWVGPLLRAQWRALFVELGYGAFGLRWDDARADLVTAEGDTDSALRTSGMVAWLLGVGGQLPVTAQLDAVFRFEYRVRYYDARDEPLVDKLVHGTQEFSPFIGVAWRID